MTSAISAAKSTVTTGFQSYGTPLEQFPLLIHHSRMQSNKQIEKGRNSILVCAWTKHIQTAFKTVFNHGTYTAHFLMQPQLQTAFLPDEFLAIRFHLCN